MITNFKIFESILQKPEIDENTIRIEGERGWYIDFYFEESDIGDKLIYIDNKWHIKIPEWYGFSFSDPIVPIRIWAKKYDPKCEVYYILRNATNKYNL